MTTHHLPDEHGRYSLRQAAAGVLREATERGDMDHPTLTWVVGRLLDLADQGELANTITDGTGSHVHPQVRLQEVSAARRHREALAMIAHLRAADSPTPTTRSGPWSGSASRRRRRCDRLTHPVR